MRISAGNSHEWPLRSDFTGRTYLASTGMGPNNCVRRTGDEQLSLWGEWARTGRNFAS
jgi:hypothetical protein